MFGQFSLWSTGPTAAAAYTAEDCFWYLNPTPEQSGTLTSFREVLQKDSLLVEQLDDDHTLLRFLMARDFSVQKALDMYKDMRSWRAENGVNGLYQADPSGASFPELKQLLQVYPHFTCNTDKFGRPVYIELLGRTDAGQLFDTITMERLIRYHIWTWERYLWYYLPGCSAAAGKRVCTTTVIIDLAGLSLKNFNMATQKLLNTFSKIDQDYYPEHLGMMFVINTPFIFRGIWAAVQPLLQERTRKKIILLGTDYLTELTKVVPLENLPTLLGGKQEVDASYDSVGPWLQHQPVALEREQRPQEQQQEEAKELACSASGVRSCAVEGHNEVGSQGTPSEEVVAFVTAPAAPSVAAAEADDEAVRQLERLSFRSASEQVTVVA